MPATVPQEQHPAAAPRPGRALTDGQQLLVGVDAVIILRGWSGEQRQSHFLFLERHEEQDAGSPGPWAPEQTQGPSPQLGLPYTLPAGQRPVSGLRVPSREVQITLDSKPFGGSFQDLFLFARQNCKEKRQREGALLLAAGQHPGAQSQELPPGRPVGRGPSTGLSSSALPGC